MRRTLRWRDMPTATISGNNTGPGPPILCADSISILHLDCLKGIQIISQFAQIQSDSKKFNRIGKLHFYIVNKPGRTASIYHGKIMQPWNKFSFLMMSVCYRVSFSFLKTSVFEISSPELLPVTATQTFQDHQLILEAVV